MLYPDINSQKRTQQNTTRYRTALYLRLSREDGDKTESDSIANQRTLLEAYAIDHPELCIVDEFVDDGYSGSNFERPAFQRLFQELEQGTINCILVKDLSRFGRNYIEVGRYLERIFPVMRVRLIAVTDNDYIADHQMNMFEDFIGYQSSTVLDEPEREAGTTSIPIPQREESENIPLPDLSGQLENVQQSGNEIAKRGMPT